MQIRDIAPELAEKMAQFEAHSSPSMADHLGIELQRIEKDVVTARMPVEPKTRQPFGFLHGGASVALAETLASFAAWLNIDENIELAMGLEINANHIKAVREGFVYGTATALHRGRSTQVWEVRIHDEQQALVCISRCTVSIRPIA